MELQPTAVILIVGLNRSLLEQSHHLLRFSKKGIIKTLKPDFPAVTCTVQSSMVTGLTPQEHGIVGNGWYDRQLSEVQFWKQSNKLVCGEKVWETAKKKDPRFTCLNMFWWYNMYSTADYSVTPRPQYRADGRKIPDCYSEPEGLRNELQEKLGPFPLFNFWGPNSSIKSSQWIADATLYAHQKYNPTLSLVYLPHLDYPLQQFGPYAPQIKQHVEQIDAVAGKLIDYFEANRVTPIIVSEYGIEEMKQAIPINRLLREEGGLKVREEQGRELLDPGRSQAFAVVDHQIAHIYLSDPQHLKRYLNFFHQIPGVERVFARGDEGAPPIFHPRAGDIVLMASPNHWFNYGFWLDDSKAPDYARTVDIHRKPGYDPLELHMDPTLSFPYLRMAWKMARHKMGMRTLFDFIPLDPNLVGGSHGRVDLPHALQPLIITEKEKQPRPEEIPCQQVRDIILEHVHI